MSDVGRTQHHHAGQHAHPSNAAISMGVADSIAFGRPWIVQDRRLGSTAVAVKKCGGHEDEIIWYFTFGDGSGDYCDPDVFAERFTPVAPMVPLTTGAPQLSSNRADDLQIALWTALAAPLEIRGPATEYTRLQELVQQLDDRADAFPAVLAALIAERAVKDSHDRP